jgi:hypothetical protein
LQRVFVDDIRLLAPFVQCSLPAREVSSTCADPPEQGALSEAGAPSGGAPSWCDPTPRAGESEIHPNAPTLPVDDLEDGDAISLPLPGGRAQWGVFNDETSGALQAPPAECLRPTRRADAALGGEFSMRTTGCGFRGWGAGVQLVFSAGPECAPAPFDASGYDGLEFGLTRSATNPPITLKLNTSSTVPPDAGGVCIDDCYNAFQSDLALVDGLNRIPFLALHQTHNPRLLNVGKLMSVVWSVPATSSFDFAVDDVRFYRQ